MLSHLPKLAEKNFIIAFLLPTILMAIAMTILFRDVMHGQLALGALLLDQILTSLTISVLSIWIAAIILSLWNIPIYRLLEGYNGPMKWVDEWLHRKRMLCKFRAEADALQRLHRNRDNRDESDRAAYWERYEAFRREFPYLERLVLPTEFGNVIRAFETYPLNVYGLDAIPAWPRLQAVIPKEYGELINDARSQVDFFVNVTIMAAIFAFFAAVRANIDICRIISYIIDENPGSCFRTSSWAFPLSCGIAIAIAMLGYKMAVNRAQSWGNVVKGAFDLYIPELAKQLGYILPETKDGRKAFWYAVNTMFIYHGEMDPKAWSESRNDKSEKVDVKIDRINYMLITGSNMDSPPAEASVNVFSAVCGEISPKHTSE